MVHWRLHSKYWWTSLHFSFNGYTSHIDTLPIINVTRHCQQQIFKKQNYRFHLATQVILHMLLFFFSSVIISMNYLNMNDIEHILPFLGLFWSSTYLSECAISKTISSMYMHCCGFLHLSITCDRLQTSCKWRHWRCYHRLLYSSFHCKSNEISNLNS
jgi:hypothetical protein